METTPNHSQRAHALLSASGAHRWLNCPPSARLEEQYGEKSTSSYAAEGTLAHELAELYLRHDALNSVSDADFEDAMDTILQHELFSNEMLDMVPIYTEYCYDQFTAAKANNPEAVMVLEQKLDLTEFIPESFGSADCTIINDDTIEVVDLKYGKGIPVYAEWNPQLMLYGLGALRQYDTMYDIHFVRLTIVQPRINNISSWQISVEELLEWAYNTVKPTADMAFRGEGELGAGDWCRFCAVKNQCRKLYEKQLELAKYEFSKPALLSDEEISEIITRTPKLVEWLNGIVEWARLQAINNHKKWPGLKLIESAPRRKWIEDEEKIAATVFKNFPNLIEEDIFQTKLIGLTEMKRLLGPKNFDKYLADCVTRPQGKLQLVQENDPRPTAGLEQAQIDFSEE